MNADAVNLWLVILTALSLIGGALGGWVLWSFRRGFLPRHEWDAFRRGVPADLCERLDTTRERGRRQDERLAILESQMDGVPSRDELRALENTITRVEGTISGLDHRLEGFNRLLERVEKQTTIMDNHLRERDTAGR